MNHDDDEHYDEDQHHDDHYDGQHYEEEPRGLPWWSRSRLRWINALGFAITFVLIVWVVLFGLGLVNAKERTIPFPMGFSTALFVSLSISIGLLLTLILGFAWRGKDLGAHRPRQLLFFWSLASALYFLVQGAIIMKYDSESYPAPHIANELFWSLCPIGLLTFLALSYVNSELPHDEEHGEWEEEEEEHYDHAH